MVDVPFINAVQKRPRFAAADGLDVLKIVEEPANL
jgi:hypothetical protein